MREHNVGSFIESINGAHRDSADTVMMTVRGFAGEPEALYVALDYAYHSDVTVTMEPATEHESGPILS